MKQLFLFCLSLVLLGQAGAQQDIVIKKKDRRRDILIRTTLGDMTVRLSDSTPLHRDNFIRLVKQHYYDSVLFHRVINKFMIQSGDPNSRRAAPRQPLGNGGPGYTVPAEFRATLFHKKGALAAARMGDDVNPQKASSGSQFYIAQGKSYSPAGLDSLENGRLKRKVSPEHRAVYTTLGGVPHLDQHYTVFGEVIKGLDVLDKIAAVETSKDQNGDFNRPLEDVRIISTKLVKRRK